MSYKSRDISQEQRYRDSNPLRVYAYVEKQRFEFCEIFNVDDPLSFMFDAMVHLGDIVENNFVSINGEAQKTIPTMAEFVVWHFLVKILSEFEENFARNGQNHQWFSKGSPTFIDIVALKKVDDKWRFFAIEIKWSENCDYQGQVRQGLVSDLKKLYRNDYSNRRLGTHITALKAQLRSTRTLSPKQIEEIFSDIDTGTKPSEAKGIDFWGFFVSDWNAGDIYHNPDHYFRALNQISLDEGWSHNNIHASMIQIKDAKEWLCKLAMGECK